MKIRITTIALASLILLAGCSGNLEEADTPEKEVQPIENTDSKKEIITLKQNEGIIKKMEEEEEVIEGKIAEQDNTVIGTLVVKDNISDEKAQQLVDLYTKEIKTQYNDVPVDVKIERESKDQVKEPSKDEPNTKNSTGNSNEQGGENPMKLTELPEASLKVQMTPLNATQVVLMIEELPADLAKASALTLDYDGKTFELTKSKTGKSFQHTFDVVYDINDVKTKATVSK